MDENQINEEKELTQEEKLKKANDDANVLLTNLQAKKEEYENLLKDLSANKEEIQNTIKEISTAKETFIDDINNKLEEYETKFKEKDKEINNQKTSFIEMFQNLENQFNKLVTDYESKSEQGQQEIEDKITECSELLNKEQNEFDKFIENNKRDYDQKYIEISTLANKYNATTTESLTNIDKREKSITTSQAKIEKIEADCQVIKDAIVEYIDNMNLKTKEIDEKTKKYNEDTQKIIKTNKEQTEEISRQLELATGVGLFAAFKKRKDELEIGQWIWLGILVVSIFIFIGFSCWLVGEFQKIDWSNVNWFVDIFLKITASTPVLYLVAFVTDRYTKERRLLEEYAFKSTISLALKPYFDMVSSNQITDEEREFLIKSIENIFATPTDKVYRTKECQNKVAITHLSEGVDNIKNLGQKNTNE